MHILFYHYPKCKKSRAGLEYIYKMGIEPTIINYIEEGISEQRLKELSELLKLKPSQMVRQQEEVYKEELRHKVISEEEWLEILSNNPRLIKRPIIVVGNEAVIADPPQTINELLTA